MDPASVVQAIDLGNEASAKQATPTDGESVGKGEIEDKKPQSFVILGNLLSFDGNVSKELINDLIDVSLFAQLAASTSCDRLKNAIDWYKECSKYMNMLGWSSREFNFVSHKSRESVFEISTAVTDKAKEIIANKKGMLSAMERTFEALKKADSKTLELFYSNSSGGRDGNFEVGTCTQDKSGIITMASVSVYFTTEEMIKDFMFFKHESTKIKMFMSASTLTFNETQYARVRVQVQEKLGDIARKDVRKLRD